MNGKNPIARQDYLALSLLIAAVIWFNRELVSTNQVPFFRDLGPFFYPMRFVLAESFKAGELPLWDRHTGMGFPLLANFQSGAFYLPNLVYLVLPFFTAVKAIFLLHYLIAITGCYMLFRQWKYPTFLSVIGALIFTLGGTIVSLSNLMNHFQTAVWLPWLILLGERAFLAPCRKNFLAFTVIALIQFLAGSPELYTMSMGLLLLDGIRLKTGEAAVPYRRTLFLFFAANALAVGLAMIQVLPTVELFLESRGPEPLSYQVASAWSLRPVSLINVFFPYGEVDTSTFSGIRLFFRNDIPLIVSHYIGVISLFGLCLWFFTGSRKGKGVVLGLIATSLILALGDYSPVYPWLYRFIPLFDIFRFPEKFFFLTHTLLVFAVLRGISAFIKEDYPYPRKAIAALSSVCIVLTLLYLFTRLEMESVSRFISWTTGTPLYFPPMLKSVTGAFFYLERQIALGFGLLLLLFLWKRGNLKTNLFQSLIVLLVFVDLSTANRPYQYLLDPGFMSQGDNIIRARDPEPHRLFYYPGPDNVHPNYFMVNTSQSFAEMNYLLTKNLVPNTGVFHGFDYMQELDALLRRTYRIFVDVANRLPPEKQYRLLGALNVKYVMSLVEAPPGGLSLIRHFPEYPSWLYRLNGEVPRAYIVRKAYQEENPVKVLDQLASLEFDSLNEVILEKPISIPTNGNFQSQVKILNYENQSVTLNASLSDPGILVLADSLYPGWRVYLNGEEQEILRANLFFRAVSLPRGEHQVEFRFQPLSFTIGSMISLMTAIGVVAWIVAPHLNFRTMREWVGRRFGKVHA